MRKNSLYATAMLVILLGSTTLFGQMSGQQGGGMAGHGQGMSADQRLAHMTRQLNLSDAQQQQIKPILENESKQMESLRADQTLSPQDRRSKMQQLRQETSSQINPILNSDQQQKYAEMMSRQGQRRGGAGQTPTPQ
jgi:Spy/CpxP family protein refolding chaperone